MSTPEKEHVASAIPTLEAESAARPDSGVPATAASEDAASSVTAGDGAASKTNAAVAPKPPTPPPPKATDRTMELDLAQVDLLDLPLPPSSTPNLTSKGPPPLPPAMPSEPGALAEPQRAAMPPARVSARQLLEGAPPRAGNPVARFLMGLGAATLISAVGLFFVLKSLHKAHPAAPLASTSVAASVTTPIASAAPMRTITIAPIEMTAPAVSDDPSATASGKPGAAGSSRPAATHGTSAGTGAGASTGKPHPGPDDVIKVEN